MNLGIAGRSAIVCASTRGLGLACAEALLAEGVNVTINGRDLSRLRATADRLSRTWPARVNAVAADLATRAGRDALFAACAGPDILVTNGSGPDPGEFFSFDEACWIEALNGGMIAPLMLIQRALPAMQARKFGRIVNITSAMVTTPRPKMALSSGARAGLVAAVKGVLMEAAKDNVTINNLAPERFDTDRQVAMAERLMAEEVLSWDQARARQVEGIPAKRLGRPAEFGATCAFICSEQAAYMTGMNIRLDGGSYPALL